MRRWQLLQAKSRFGEVVELAIKDGPQMVMRDDQEAVVILDAATFSQLRGAHKSLISTLLNAPRGNTLEVERVRDPVRETPDL